MKTYFKGLMSIKILKKYLLIICLMIITVASLFLIENYFKVKKEIHENQPEFRTLYFESESISEQDLSSFSIESQEIYEDEFTIVFSSKDDMKRFVELYNSKFEIVREAVDMVQGMERYVSSIFAVIIVIANAILSLLILIFTINYFIAIHDSIRLYVVLGDKSKVVKIRVAILLAILYFLINCLVFIIIKLVTLFIPDIFFITNSLLFESFLKNNLIILGTVLLALLVVLFLPLKRKS